MFNFSVVISNTVVIVRCSVIFSISFFLFHNQAGYKLGKTKKKKFKKNPCT